MNYLTEIRLFYEWLETHQLSPYTISLWHALVYTASRAGWTEELTIPVSVLTHRTQMGKSTVYRARTTLAKHGLISVESRGNSQSPIYRLHSLEGIVVPRVSSRSGTHSGTPCGTHPGTQQAIISRCGTRCGNIYRVNSDTDDNTLSSVEHLDKSVSEKKDKKNGLEEWAKQQESPWRELMLIWLDYKRTRKESYRSEIGAKKCLTMLRNLSRGNADIAQRIIDQSMANNWAGLFALREDLGRGHPPEGRQYGQRIGQIIQSNDEQKRQRYIDKLKNAGKKQQ